MNKISKFFLAVAAISMTACSSDEPVNPVTPDADGTYGNKYLSVSFQMPTSIGGRAEGEADNDKDKYTDGTEAESNVDNVVFLFFDANNNCIDTQTYTDIVFDDTDLPSPNPFVTSIGKREIRLKAGLSYNQMAVALNVTDAGKTRLNGVSTLSDLQAISANYVGQITATGNNKGANQMMTNSVYYNTPGNSTSATPKEADKVILVPITEDNIYDSDDRTSDGSLPSGKKYVDVYVERVVARVDVTEATFNMDNYYIDQDKKTTTITIYDNINLTSEEVIVKPVVQGMCLNVLAPKANLIKEIALGQVGYDAPYASLFQWNDPLNKRSYWAQTPNFTKTGANPENVMQYFSWTQAKTQGPAAFTQYIHPNTLDYQIDKENSSLNTKIMVVANLHKYNAQGEDLGTIDLVRYGGDYMEKSNLLVLTANRANLDVRAIDWKNGTFKNGETEIELSAAEREILNVAVSHAFADGGFDDSYFDLVVKSNSVGYEAEVAAKTAYSLVINPDDLKVTIKGEDGVETSDYASEDIKTILESTELTNALVAKANTIIANYAGTVLDAINEPFILFWNEGMTYFYTTIKQQGFYGLVGGATNYLNGVVRNHIYKVSLDGIYGLGTPVIDPGLPIDPERPTPEKPSYLQAKINILPWRIVPNSATIH